MQQVFAFIEMELQYLSSVLTFQVVRLHLNQMDYLTVKGAQYAGGESISKSPYGASVICVFLDFATGYTKDVELKKVGSFYSEMMFKYKGKGEVVGDVVIKAWNG